MIGLNLVAILSQMVGGSSVFRMKLSKEIIWLQPNLASSVWSV